MAATVAAVYLSTLLLSAWPSERADMLRLCCADDGRRMNPNTPAVPPTPTPPAPPTPTPTPCRLFDSPDRLSDGGRRGNANSPAFLGLSGGCPPPDSMSVTECLRPCLPGNMPGPRGDSIELLLLRLDLGLIKGLGSPLLEDRDVGPVPPTGLNPSWDNPPCAKLNLEAFRGLERGEGDRRATVGGNIPLVVFAWREKEFEDGKTVPPPPPPPPPPSATTPSLPLIPPPPPDALLSRSEGGLSSRLPLGVPCVGCSAGWLALVPPLLLSLLLVLLRSLLVLRELQFPAVGTLPALGNASPFPSSPSLSASGCSVKLWLLAWLSSGRTRASWPEMEHGE